MLAPEGFETFYFGGFLATEKHGKTQNIKSGSSDHP
jgi:hypothetical protein